MNQNIWGPHLWFSLHTISFNYPLIPTNEDKDNYKMFYVSMQHVIPCSICKKNYIRHLKEHPIEKHLNSRKLLVYWVIDIHNMVNSEIGKKILSYDKIIKKYETVYNKKIILEGDDNDIENDIVKQNINYVQIINGFFIIFIVLLIINLINIFIVKKKLKL